MNGFNFQMPETIDVEHLTYSATYGMFIVQPLERGYATTIGNALRRVLLSSLPGAAITALRIDGIQHEFSTIKGVKEDVSEIIMAFSQVRLKLTEKMPDKVRIHLQGPMILTAGDLQKGTTDFEVLNPELEIATLNKDADFTMEFTLAKGRGYVPSEENRTADMPIGTIPLDAIYTPIEKVKYSIENTRVGQRTDYEKLILEIWTDGSITPDDAVTFSGKVLRDHITLFTNFEVKPGEEEEDVETDEEILKIKRLLRKPVDELELSVRSANCLKEAKIRTISDLVSRDEAEMLKFKNFGRKSLNELNDILSEHALTFGFDVEKYLGQDAVKRSVEG
ncbi:DNA-directed RNA polymerase subunit alpha [Calditrichota bacterium]